MDNLFAMPNQSSAQRSEMVQFSEGMRKGGNFTSNSVTPDAVDRDQSVTRVDSEGNLAQKLEDLVSTAEASLRAGCAVIVDPNVARDISCGVSSTTQIAPLTIKRAGHRLWQVCGAAASAAEPLLHGAAGAGARELACELIEIGMARTGGWPSRDQFDLILQWAVIGKAWLDLSEFAAAIRCLGRSNAAWDAYLRDGHARQAPDVELERLGEATLQTQLWLASAHTASGGHDQAFMALSKAMSIQKGSPSLAALSRGLLIRACQEQAVVHTGRGDARLAADVLTLALSALPAAEVSDQAGSARAERAEVLRQLALCNSELQEHDVAVARAREALRLEAPGSSGHAKALRASLAILCAPGIVTESASTEPGGEQVREAALEFVDHRRASLGDCLGVCRDLADRGLEGVCLACLRRLRFRLRDSPEELATAWLFGAQLLATRVEEVDSAGCHSIGKEAATDCLSEILDEIEASPTRPAEVGRRMAVLLWNLGEALCRRNCPQLATVWLGRALPFLAEVGRAGAGWRSLAFCHQAAGDLSQARRCAETALVHDPTDTQALVLLMLDAVGRSEAGLLRELIAKTKAADDKSAPPLTLSVAQATLLYAESSKAQSVAQSSVRLDCLELLWQCASDDVASAQELGISQPWILRTLLATAEEFAEPIGRLIKYLASASQLTAISECELCWLFEFAWRKGIYLAEHGSWQESFSMFKHAYSFVERCGCRGVTDQVWCTAAIIQVLLRASEQETSAAASLRLRKVALSWVEKEAPAVSAASENAEGSNFKVAERLLAKLHFETLCLLGNPIHGSLADTLIAAVGNDESSCAVLAALAAQANDKETCARCLRAYLRCATRWQNGGAMQNEFRAAAQRALVTLCGQGVAFEAVAEAMLVLKASISTAEADEEHSEQRLQDIVLPCGMSKGDASWLFAVAWNGCDSGSGEAGNHLVDQPSGVVLDFLGCLARCTSAKGLCELHAKLDLGLQACTNNI